MTNDVCYPIRRGTDRDEALAAIGRLTEIGDGLKAGFEHSLHLGTPAAADVIRYAGLKGWCTLSFVDP